MTALIAVDMPLAVPSVIKLFSEISVDDDAVMYIDADGFKQPLAAVYRVESVRGALAHAGNVDGKSMRELVSQLNVREVHLSQEISPALIDIDTQLDLDRAITTLASRKGNL
jgi:molybdopterin-guanine dinucleotide biosynthesis protein A